MTAPPAGALEACLALLEKATPGPWKVFETEIPHYGKSGPHVARNIYTAWKHPQLQSEYPIVCQATGVGATKEGPCVQFTNISPDNAAAIVSAVNLLKDHGPALLAALRLREGWIPVSERLPLELPPANGVYETVDVLAFDGHRVQQMDFQAGNGAGKPWRSFTNYGSLQPQEITHWMPLPAPPTADDLARVLEEGGMNEPAFPINGGIAENQYNGMTLRDYFAAKAMAAMIGTAGASCLGGLDHTEARTAQAAYHMADAMLAARTK